MRLSSKENPLSWQLCTIPAASNRRSHSGMPSAPSVGHWPQKGCSLISMFAQLPMSRLPKGTLAGLLLLLPLAAAAVEKPTPVMKVCIADQDVPPFSYARYESQVQQQLRHAARRHGWELSFSVRPWLRCQVEAMAGKFDALLPMAPGELNLEAFVFPEHQGEPDPALSLGMVRVVAARQQGSSANWDGQHFSGVQGPVLYLQGLNALSEHLARVGIGSTSARTTLDMVRMLLAGRSNLAVDIEPRLRQTLEAMGMHERIQILPDTVLAKRVYLTVSRPFYARHKDLVDGLWHDTAGTGEQAENAPAPGDR